MAIHTARDFAEFNALLASATERGIPLDRALDLAGSQTQNSRLRTAIEGVTASVREGGTLTDALRSRPDVFPEEYCELVEAGARGRQLPDALRQAETNAILRSRLRRGLLRVSLYAGIGVALALVVILVITRMAGYFGEVFQSVRVPLPYLTEVAIWFGRHAAALPVLGLVLACVVGLSFYLWHLVVSRGRVGYHLPAWGLLQKNRDLGLFCVAMGFRLQSGAPLPESIRAAEGAIPNRYARHRVRRLAHRVEEGESLSSALFYDSFFPRTLAWAVSMAEEGGSVPDTFRMFAEMYSRDAERNVEILLTLMTPVAILILGNIVALTVMSVILPLVSMLQGIGM